MRHDEIEDTATDRTQRSAAVGAGAGQAGHVLLSSVAEVAPRPLKGAPVLPIPKEASKVWRISQRVRVCDSAAQSGWRA